MPRENESHWVKLLALLLMLIIISIIVSRIGFAESSVILHHLMDLNQIWLLRQRQKMMKSIWNRHSIPVLFSLTLIPIEVTGLHQSPHKWDQSLQEWLNSSAIKLKSIIKNWKTVWNSLIHPIWCKEYIYTIYNIDI